MRVPWLAWLVCCCRMQVSRGHAEEGRVGTTVVDMTSRDARVVRAGAGDPEPFGGVPEVDLSDEAIQSELKVRPVPNRMPKAMADVVMWD